MNHSGMTDDELLTEKQRPADATAAEAPVGAPDAAGETDDYSDAERDEVAARLASLGYIDE
jgi:hypothetical protein